MATRGWPKGRPRNAGTTRTRQHGPWAWNPERLLEKQRQTTADACWEWLGSRGPYGALFGVSKNGRPQMTQANRVLAMEYGMDCDNKAVFMRCHNKWCCNHNHFVILPLKGTPRGIIVRD